MLVVITPFLLGRIREELASSALLDCIDDVDREIRIRCKALAIFAGVTLAVRIHNLPSSNLADKLAEWRRRRRSFIYRHHFFWSWDKTSFIASFAKLINGHVFELWKMDSIAEDIQLLI